VRRPEDRARNTGDPEPSEHPTITARNLSCGYHRHAILTGVDLEVSTGEVLCLLGPNGVGKTTLFRTLLGHLPPVSGRVEINGREHSSLSRRQVARPGTRPGPGSEEYSGPGQPVPAGDAG